MRESAEEISQLTLFQLMVVTLVIMALVENIGMTIRTGWSRTGISCQNVYYLIIKK